MILLLLFGLLLLPCEAEELIVCQNEEDYYQFLYQICIQSSPCRHLYHLYPLDQVKENEVPETAAFIDYRNSRDFDLFRHQLERSLIFRMNGTLAVKSERRLVLQNLVPNEWLPDVRVLLKADHREQCHKRVIGRTHALYILYALHIYKVVVADEYFCHDPNERLLLDPLTNSVHCVCKKGKSCHNESNFTHLITLLMSLLIFGVFLLSVAIFASLFYKRHLLLKCL